MFRPALEASCVTDRAYAWTNQCELFPFLTVAGASNCPENVGGIVKVKNIVLIGMSGAGKSTLGVLLAKALRMDFVDTDIVIQQDGRLLHEIIDNDGIEKFMEVEEKVVSALQVDNCIIATGGSVIYSEKAMNALKRDGQIVYLHVPYEEIERRLIDITSRGIVIRPGNRLLDVYEERVPLYIKYSDITLDCSNKDIEHCVSEAIKKIQEISRYIS